jgi:putative flippase GtrA
MMSFLKNPQERNRFYKFAVVGLIGAVIDFSVMNILVHYGFSFTTAGTISFLCAVISNFFWNRFWTYPESRSKNFIGQLLQFFLVNTAGLLIRFPILKFVEPVLDTTFISFSATKQAHQALSHNLTLAMAVGIVMMWNFIINRYWTYNDVD